MLGEAAEIEETSRGDWMAAERCLALALRLSPRDGILAANFRRVAARVVNTRRPTEAPEAAPPTPLEAIAPTPLQESQEPQDESIGKQEARAEALTNRLRANPEDHATAMELAGILERLGHDLELIALLSARMEEGGPEVQQEVSPLRRRVLLRVAQKARDEGRPGEAELYEMMAAAGSEGE
jgi:hypothetical protein